MVWSAYSRAASNPWAELSRLQSELERLFTTGDRPASDEFPPIDVWSGEEGVRIFAQLAGFAPENIEISIVGDTLTLKGLRPEESEGPAGPAGNGAWHRRERGSGRFVRTLQLPFAIEADAVKAAFKNGILDIELPRAASEKPRRITVAAS